MRRLWKASSGNVLIMVAISLAVLASFGVLSIDVGRMLVTKTQLQNAADAAALAGASVFCDNPAATEAEAKARAKLIGAANEAMVDEAVPVDMDAAQIVVTKSATDNTVDVTVSSNTTQYFLNVVQVAMKQIGAPVNDALVSANAVAHCGAVCNNQCVKPWSPPDRWNDFSNVAGHANWNGNNQYDSEPWTDRNGNFQYDQGVDTFTDQNANGRFDGEEYHPLLTGYIPDPYPGNSLSPNGDLGLQIVLKHDNGGNPQPGQYQPVDLPPINKGTPIPGANQYRWNIANCNPQGIEPGDILQTEPGNMVGPTAQGMDDLIKLDPTAYWDPTTQSVQGSRFDVSPRIVLIPMHDPRYPIASGRVSQLRVTKVAAYFMEDMNGKQVIGRFLKVRGPGDPCPAGVAAGSFVKNLSLTQ
jgi:Flp pilus assembly protein TadG